MADAAPADRSPAKPPRFALFLLDAADAETLEGTLARIPADAFEWLEQIVLVQGPQGATTLADAARLAERVPCPLHLHSGPRRYGYGGDRKAALEYALREGADYAVLMRGDGRHPPELLPRLLRTVVDGGEMAVVGSRLATDAVSGGSGLSRGRAAGHAASRALLNRILGLRLRDYTSGFRVYPVEAIRRIPFELDSDDRAFDVEILIQLRALGLPITEVPVRPGWREEPLRRREARQVVGAWATAVDYRLHQLHVTRRGRYLVDRGVRYTLKRSETGSHMQIVGSIRPGSRVLDLGCSQGLLAGPLRRKEVSVVGVDDGPPDGLREDLAAYYRRDLELPLELPLGREFDYVVVADVIEHVRHRQQLLRDVRRFLKPDGRLVISTGNVALWFYRLSLLVGRFEYGPRGILDRTHVHLYTRATFRREVERAGFHVLRERYTSLPFEVVFESTGRSRLVRWTSRVYHRLACLWPSLFAYQIVLEGEIRTLDEEATQAI